VGKRKDGRQSLRNLFHTAKRVASVTAICSSAHALANIGEKEQKKKRKDRRKKTRTKHKYTNTSIKKRKHGRKDFFMFC
jgi:hypothetical protein